MDNLGINPSKNGIDTQGIKGVKTVYWNLPPAELVQHAIRNGESRLSDTGALASLTGQHTGRSPKDKFFVIEPSSKDKIHWDSTNIGIDEDKFDKLHRKVLDYLSKKDTLYVQDLFGGANKEYQIPVRVITEYAWHNLFIRQLLVRPDKSELSNHKPEFTIIDAANFKANPAEDGTRS